MDKAHKLARQARLLFHGPKADEGASIGHADETKQLAVLIRAYGEACRRAGAEAMREAAAKTAGDCVVDRRESQLAMLAIHFLPLPPAAEAAGE